MNTPTKTANNPLNAIQQINTYGEIDELAKATVLYAIHNVPSPDAFFEPQGTDSIFYKVYNDLCNRANHLGSYFALQLQNKYEINIPIR